MFRHTYQTTGVFDEYHITSRLLKSLDGIGWPKKIDYPAVPAENRKEFETAFREMLSLQLE